MQAFISYKSEYRDFALRLRDTLHSWGHRTWLDVDDIPKGSYFRTEIERGLASSDIVIGVMTPEALESREVQPEFDYAYNKGNLLPLLYRRVTLPYHLQSRQYIDFTKDETQGFRDLQQALTKSEEFVK